MRHMIRPSLILLCCLLPALVRPQTTQPLIRDDNNLSRIMSSSRERFLKNKPFDRLDATILVQQPDGSWLRGSHNPESIAYPASCVKFAYMAAAMHWCRENNLPHDHLDESVRPMIEVSSNEMTGVVVDAITSAPNDDTITTHTDPRFPPWLEKRRYTERFLSSHDLLGNQVIVHKTYPANSGPMPSGAEKVARELIGMNKMQPRLSASLILGIVDGQIEPWAKDYMRELLSHDRWRGNSVIGHALPPGSIYYNKPGNAYDTVEDIAYIVLPNGRKFVMAIFTNAFVRPYSRDTSMYNKSVFSNFCDLVLEQTDLLKGCPAKIVVDSFDATGDWQTSSAVSQFGESFVTGKSGEGKATVAWKLPIVEAGKYELCVWYPHDTEFATDAPYTVHAADETTTIRVNQQKAGGQWFKLGDFHLAPATAKVVLTDAASSPSLTVAADAVRAWQWPTDPARH